MGQWINDKSDGGVLRTLQTFVDALGKQPGAYGVSDEYAAKAVALVAELDRAVAAAANRATRTMLTTAAKRDARDAALHHCTALVRLIRANLNLSDADRARLGIPAPAARRRVPVPSTAPVLVVRGIIPGGHEIEMYDSAAGPRRRGRPRDVHALHLFVAYSPIDAGREPAIDEILRAAEPIAILTRGRSAVTHPDARTGSVANYVGQWVNTRWERGPWSQPVRMVLALTDAGATRRSAAA